MSAAKYCSRAGDLKEPTKHTSDSTYPRVRPPRALVLGLALTLVLKFATFHILVLVLILLLLLVVLAHVLVFGLIVLHLLVFLLDHPVRRRLGHRRGRPAEAEVEGSWRCERPSLAEDGAALRCKAHFECWLLHFECWLLRALQSFECAIARV